MSSYKMVVNYYCRETYSPVERTEEILSGITKEAALINGPRILSATKWLEDKTRSEPPPSFLVLVAATFHISLAVGADKEEVLVEPFWVGYFENLISVEALVEESFSWTYLR